MRIVQAELGELRYRLIVAAISRGCRGLRPLQRVDKSKSFRHAPCPDDRWLQFFLGCPKRKAEFGESWSVALLIAGEAGVRRFESNVLSTG